MESFTAAFTSAYLANIAGSLTLNFIQGAGRRIRKQLQGTEAETALKRCIAAGAVAAIANAAVKTAEEINLISDIFSDFFTDPDTGKEIAELFSGGTPNPNELLVIFEDAVQAFEAAFLEAVIEEPLFQPIIQTNKVKDKKNYQKKFSPIKMPKFQAAAQLRSKALQPADMALQWGRMSAGIWFMTNKGQKWC